MHPRLPRPVTPLRATRLLNTRPPRHAYRRDPLLGTVGLLEEDAQALADLARRVLELLGREDLAEGGGLQELALDLFEVHRRPVAAGEFRHGAVRYLE